MKRNEASYTLIIILIFKTTTFYVIEFSVIDKENEKTPRIFRGSQRKKREKHEQILRGKVREESFCLSG